MENPSPLLITTALLVLLTTSSATLLLPVSKDKATNQYVTRIGQKTPTSLLNLVVDLGARYSWVTCENGSYVSSTFSYIPCNSPDCTAAFSKPQACNDNRCGVFPDNRYSKFGFSGDLAQDSVTLQSTDGVNPQNPVTVPNVTFSCTGKSTLDGLLPGASGMAGLGRTGVSLPSQLASTLAFPNKFAVCLPSAGASDGVIFFGEGPYHFLPNKEFSSASFVYTPLIVNKVSTAGISFSGEPSSEYFVSVNAVKVNGKNVPIDVSLLSIKKNGNGGTKLSSVKAYTVLEASIYKAVVDAFTRESGLKRVAPVAPFGACFDGRKVGSTRVGPAVPPIELAFASGTSWIWYGANTMVQVRPGVLCLAMEDGGTQAPTSIVVGGYQMDNNLLVFDLVKKRLGITGTLLSTQTTCSNFNFAAVPNFNFTA